MLLTDEELDMISAAVDAVASDILDGYLDTNDVRAFVCHENTRSMARLVLQDIWVKVSVARKYEELFDED